MHTNCRFFIINFLFVSCLLSLSFCRTKKEVKKKKQIFFLCLPSSFISLNIFQKWQINECAVTLAASESHGTEEWEVSNNNKKAAANIIYKISRLTDAVNHSINGIRCCWWIPICITKACISHISSQLTWRWRLWRPWPNAMQKSKARKNNNTIIHRNSCIIWDWERPIFLLLCLPYDITCKYIHRKCM